MISFEESPVAYLAYQRARMKAVQARAEKKLGQLGKETATRSRGLTRAEVRERDARSIKRFARLFSRHPRVRPRNGTTITLASGRRLAWDEEREGWVNAR